MAHLTGLFQRGRAYYIKIVLPKDHPLRPRFRNGRFVQSLGISSHREAVRLGALKRAEILWGAHPGGQQPRGVAQSLSAPGATTLPIPAPLPRPTLTLRRVYDRWQLAKPRSQDTEAACLRALCLFEECLGKSLDLNHLTRAQGDEFRAWLLAKSATTKTSRDRFTWVKSLLKYAVRDLEMLPKSPWEGLDIASKTTARRRPWKPEEIRRIFSRKRPANTPLSAAA